MSLTEMAADWSDETSSRVIRLIQTIEKKSDYSGPDLQFYLDADFEDAKTLFRLFLGLSKDEFHTRLLGNSSAGTGVVAYRANRIEFINRLLGLGVAEAMAELINRPPLWSDVLVERLRSGRGRAVKGQRRGRSLEDFVESIVGQVFTTFDLRCSFLGKDGIDQAKADVAIPARSQPFIVIEAKGYGATGSKQSDVIGDLNAIIRAKRHDTVLLFVTDGLTWRQRRNDLRKIVALQNEGNIARIYTRSMAEELRRDLQTLKLEFGIE